MRGAKSLVVLLVVLAGLGGYIYFVESKKPAGDAADVKPKVFTVEAEKIAELSVKSANGDRTTLKKSGATWQVVEPLATPADPAEVSGITSNLATVENVRGVDETGKDLAQYGLAEPKIDVAYKTAGDKAFHHLLIGDKTATGGELYAKTDTDKKVFLVAGFLEGTFNKTTFDLRDKSVLKFDRDKVDRLALAWSGQAETLALANGDWSLTEPVRVPADYGSVEAIVGRLQTAQMKGITAPESADLERYGLDKPQLRVELGTGSSQAALLLGAKADEGALYAKDAARPMVFTVESSLLDDLKKSPDQLRKKDLFSSRAYDTTGIEVVRGTEILAFEKVKGQGKDAADKWRETKPAAKDADAAKVETFLTKLTSQRAQTWVDAKTKTGLEAPVLLVTLKADGGKREEKVSFGKSGADVYAAVSGQPGAAKIDATEFDDAIKALDAAK